MILIHPYDKSTRFLLDIIKPLTSALSLTLVEVGLSDKAHEDCIAMLRNENRPTTVFFFGHGGTNYVLGACGDFANAFLFDEESIEDPSQLYSYGQFINRSNIDVFSGNKILCLSCNSGVELGPLAIEGGALVFMGFGDIPTDSGEFKKLEINLNQEEIDWFNLELVSVINEALQYALKHESTFLDFSRILRLFVTKKMGELVLDKTAPSRRSLADAFYFFKDGIRVFGQGDLKLLRD